ncbi:MAG TPA: ribosome biogenesis GTPase YlqF [Hyphomicrobiales bacterium]|nr:ribosome biogenesis GTPase YlqF [Hyphomicrobiales bacterium]
MAIGWYPGHMHKARKDITQALKTVDAVLELVDARLPYASENPLLNRLIGEVRRLRLLTKADLADPAVTALWQAYYQERGLLTLPFDKDEGKALRQILQFLQTSLPPRTSRPNRVLIVGIPNVGKSTLINLLAQRKLAKVGNEPAVTKARQEIRLNESLVLLDTPGILWPRLEDQDAAYRLAASGAIRNTAIDLADVGLYTIALLARRYPAALGERYGIETPQQPALELLEQVGRRRGCLVRGGVDLTKAGEVLLQDLRSGKLGPISLETPDDIPAAPPEEASPPA